MPCTSSPPTPSHTSKFTAPLVESTYGIQSEVCGGAFSLPPNSLDSDQTQKQKDELLDWPHVLISFKENLSTG